MTREGYRKHKEVIDWFYSNNNVTVLYKPKNEKNWSETDDPGFFVHYHYLINDEFVKLRKAIFEGKEIKRFNSCCNEWEDFNIKCPNGYFALSQEDYRVKEEIEFPIFKKNSFMVVKFLSKTKFEIEFVFNIEKSTEYAQVGTIIECDCSCLDDKQWEDVAYDKERNLWDGQPVWCFYFDKSMGRDLRFNNVKDNTVFNFRGERVKINEYNYFEPYPHLEDDWIIEAYNRLEF